MPVPEPGIFEQPISSNQNFTISTMGPVNTTENTKIIAFLNGVCIHHAVPPIHIWIMIYKWQHFLIKACMWHLAPALPHTSIFFQSM